jgi:hypothetical protein
MTQLSFLATDDAGAPRRRRAAHATPAAGAVAPRPASRPAKPRRSSAVPSRLKLDAETRARGLEHVAEARQRLAEMQARSARRSAA